jgi:YVTN family beta-propeller protein
MTGKHFIIGIAAAFAALAFGGLAGGGVSAQTGGTTAQAAAEDTDTRIVRQDMVIEFSVGPVLGTVEEERDLYELDSANVAFKITDRASGEPVFGLIPGAWIDLVETETGQETGQLACRDRIGLYLRGTTGMQPLIDINSYFILAMNEDATISVIDPNVIVGGVPNMYHSVIILPRPGGDWVQSLEQDRVFVTMPRADRLGVIDTKEFKLIEQVKTGVEPLRVALQNDERYLWVGYNAKREDGGVTVIDTATLDVAADIKTGRGHHEIAVSDDDRSVLVTNRDSGTVSVIDIGTLKKTKDIAVGKAPISIVYSGLSNAFYVADGASGTVTVIDGARPEVTARIKAKEGLGPMEISQDGRWVMVTNASKNLVHIIDASANAVAHDVAIDGKPFQVSMTRAFAYVRPLESERMSMINLAELAKGGKPIVVQVPIGDRPPSKATSLSIADMVVEAAGEAGVVAVDPAGGTLNYYMEGMNAPMGSFRAKAHKPRAVLVTDRALLERRPGVYLARIQVPKPGTYEAAFVLDSPPVLHCFRFTALPNPLLQKELKPLAIEYLTEEREVPAGKPVTMRFRLTRPVDDSPATGLSDVRVLYYRAPGQGRRNVVAREIGDGVYEADINITLRGTYYVYVSSQSAKAPVGALNYITLRAEHAGI